MSSPITIVLDYITFVQKCTSHIILPTRMTKWPPPSPIFFSLFFPLFSNFTITTIPSTTKLDGCDVLSTCRRLCYSYFPSSHLSSPLLLEVIFLPPLPIFQKICCQDLWRVFFWDLFLVVVGFFFYLKFVVLAPHRRKLLEKLRPP